MVHPLSGLRIGSGIYVQLRLTLMLDNVILCSVLRFRNVFVSAKELKSAVLSFFKHLVFIQVKNAL